MKNIWRQLWDVISLIVATILLYYIVTFLDGLIKIE